MNKYTPFWILNPLKNKLTIKSHGDWSFFTSKQVIDGISPLKDLGSEFYQISQRESSLYDNCVWIFYNLKLTLDDCNELNRIMKSTSEAFCNSNLSRPGLIILHENGNTTNQPSTPIHYESFNEENLTNEKLEKIINITENLFQKNLAEYIAIFEYMREIKKSSTFISELALWSFIEQHWNEDNNRESDLSKSLKLLSEKIYERKDPNYITFKRNLEEFIESTGGNKKTLTGLRNLLAHGTFYKQKNIWLEKQWNLFFNIHNFLNEMVLLALEKEITQKKQIVIKNENNF